MGEEPAVEPRPSATVVLLRNGRPELEVLLLRRNAKLAFHGGAWVFPGGAIDPEDWKGVPPGEIVEAARTAAVREAAEEASVSVDPEGLTPISRWTTPEGVPRRYVTWFFAAVAGDDRVRVDGGEIHAHRWMRPAEALEAQRARELELPPATFVTLLGLCAYRSAREAWTALEQSEPDIFTPRTFRVPGGLCSLYEQDAGYATTDPEREGPRHRLWMIEDGWRYERS